MQHKPNQNSTIMDKKTLNTVSELVAVEAIPKAKKDETFEEFVNRVYGSFEEFVEKSNNSVISEIQSDSRDPLKNAISKLEVRKTLVKQFCRVNDPFDIEPPKEATTAEILEHNGVKGSEDMLKEAMGEDAFNDYLERLKTPKKDGLTQTEVNEKREEHYAQYEPAFPSEKTYSHGSGGSTRGYHWQSDLQSEFLTDHQNFLDHYGLSDSFPKVEEEEADTESEDTESKGTEETAEA